MAKITALDLMCAEGWRDFFKRLGWKYEWTDTAKGVGFYSTGVFKPDGKTLVVKSMESDERTAIERTWRDQPANVAKIGAG